LGGKNREHSSAMCWEAKIQNEIISSKRKKRMKKERNIWQRESGGGGKNMGGDRGKAGANEMGNAKNPAPESYLLEVL